jgi:hypothetical protein
MREAEASTRYWKADNSVIILGIHITRILATDTLGGAFPKESDNSVIIQYLLFCRG